jgi:hypothetical protein
MSSRIKSVTLALLAVCLLLGCTTSERHASIMQRFYGFQPDSESAIGRALGRPSTEAPPVIYIGGWFRNPGLYVWTNGMTLQDAIRVGGGFTDFATRKLFLQQWDCSVERFRLSSGRTLKADAALRPGDSVLSPERSFDPHLGNKGAPAQSFY